MGKLSSFAFFCQASELTIFLNTSKIMAAMASSRSTEGGQGAVWILEQER